MAHRYFTQDIHGGSARLTGADAAHLAKALRAKPGDAITLCNGAGTDYAGCILQVSAQEVLASVDAGHPSAAEPSVRCEVYIGIAKGERMDWAVQKAVELGTATILPFYSTNTVVKPKNDTQKTERWSRIAHEAAKQCGRGILPCVEPPLSFKEVTQRAVLNDRALFFYEGGGQPLREVVANAHSFALITGAEGGFTPAEAEMAAAAGCIAVSLGPRILRCETAPAAALAALMTLTENLE